MSAATSASTSPEKGSPLSSSPTPSTHSALSIGRASGRRSMHTTPSADPLSSSHPLLNTPPEPAFYSVNGGATVGPYAVYTGKKRASGAFAAASTSSPSPSTSNLTTQTQESPSSSTLNPPPGVTPTATPPPLTLAQPSPTSPKPATNLPPLISRPSSSSLPGGSVSVTQSQRSVSDATVKLLGQRIRADVQGLGLGNESVGGLMVQKLGVMQKDAEWGPILSAISTGKVTVLLPAERPSSPSIITPAFFLDHLILLEPNRPSTSSQPPPSSRTFVTLSGLRGSLQSESLVFLSPGTALVESAKGLIKPGMLSTSPNYSNEQVQSALMGSISPPTSTSVTSQFPSTLLVSPISELSVPRTLISTIGREAISRPSSSTGSRLAALFAKAPDATRDLPPMVPAPPGVLSDINSSATTSSDSSSSPSKGTIANLDISVLAIAKYVRHTEVVKAIGKSVESQLRDTLKRIDGCEGEVSVGDRVCAFAARFQPPPTWASSYSPPGKIGAGETFFEKEVEEISDAYQDMLHAARLDIHRNMSANIAKDKKKSSSENFAVGTKAVENGDGGKSVEEVRIFDDRVDSSLELIEEVLTEVLYDRLFSPPTSGDAQADENLSSRIAALNILELSLDHLGLDLGNDGEGWDGRSRTLEDSVEDIIGLASKELARLQDPITRSPRSKLAIFVNLHKIIVEGLASLPPIPLKDSAEGPSALKPNEEVEMDDASLRTSSRSASRPASPHSQMQDDDAILRTPRPFSAALSTGTNQSSTTSSLSGDAIDSVLDATISSIFDTTGPRRESASSSSSADLILPLLIYLIVQYNPSQLPSTLMYAQRFRVESLMRGEASYCATNVQAAIEFLTHVDISTLGLSSQKVMGIGAAAVNVDGKGTLKTNVPGRFKGRVTNVSQDLDHFVDTANSTIVNVVDSSYRILFGPKGFAPKTIEDVRSVLDGAGSVASKARGSLLRRGSAPAQYGQPNNDSTSEIPPLPSVAESPHPEKEMKSIGNKGEEESATEDEMKSSRGISSLLIGEDRPSIGERLASISSGLGRLGEGVKSSSGAVTPPRGSSLFTTANSSPTPRRATIGSSSLSQSSTATTVPPPLPTSSFPFFSAATPAFAPISGAGGFAPVQKFLDCEAGDLRLGEVAELLAEYKKLVAHLEGGQ